MTLNIVTIGITTSEKLQIESMDALSILKTNHKVNAIQNGPSQMVTCIDEVCNKGGYWWKFYINGKITLESLDNYFPKDKDILLLEYGESDDI